MKRICNAGLKQQVQEKSGERLDADERAELQSLRQEVKTLRMEKEIQKTGCIQPMSASDSAYYDWRKASAKLMDNQTWHLCQRMRMYFAQSRQSMGSLDEEIITQRRLSDRPLSSTSIHK